jgi:hypothetical protein
LVFGGDGVVSDDRNEIFAIENAGDRDKRARTGEIRDEAKSSVTELGDGAVEFGETIGTAAGSTNDDHGAEITGLGLASEVGFYSQITHQYESAGGVNRITNGLLELLFELSDGSETSLEEVVSN